MQITKSEMLEFADIIAKSVVTTLEQRGLVTAQSANEKPRCTEKSAYAKTETLLYNYNGFKRVIEERQQEIEDLRKYGVPNKRGVNEYVQKGGMPHGIVLDEESVDSAIRSVQASVEGTVQAISLIDKCMDALKSDPYYCILEMRYFEGRTQEDIADHLGCSQVTISKNKNRLVKELSIRLFPHQAIQEMMN